MPSFFFTFGTILVGIIAASYPFFLKDLIFTSAGFGREVQSISEFPYSCRRISHPRLQGCEDMWLDEEKRVLYAACAPTVGRMNWTPSLNYLNAPRRSLGDHVAVFDVDKPGADGLFGLHELEMSGYTGPGGYTNIDAHGFSVQILDDNTLRFFMVNHRPPTDETGQIFLNAADVGANSTVEVFDLVRGFEASKMKWVKTVADEAVYTPNRVAATLDGGFLATNDKSAKVGIRRELFPLHGGGDVAYCPPEGPCHKASDGIRFSYPNGLVRGQDGLFYVPSSWLGKIWVLELQGESLRLVDEIATPMPIDNLSVDSNGDLYAAGFPSGLALLRSTTDPFHIESPTTVLRIRKTEGEGGKAAYLVEKVIEDRDAAVLSGATVVIHDAKSGRLFFGGNFAPHISVCEKN